MIDAIRMLAILFILISQMDLVQVGLISDKLVDLPHAFGPDLYLFEEVREFDMD
jgi:hypothetical protein